MTSGTTTLDIIHVVLEQLGYIGEEFGGCRIGPMSYAIYRQGAVSLAVGWCRGCTEYEISSSTAAVAEAVRDALAATGLICKVSGTRIDVFGQEHIDAEVRNMIAR